MSAPPRLRNRRGQGNRLREDLIRTATAMVEAGEVRELTLRGIARRAGIAATSVYIHFPDVDRLLGEVVRRCFDQLTAATGEAAEGLSAHPDEELRARCRAYCRFALEHPSLYGLMFQAGIPASVAGDPAQTPGRQSFENLVAAVQRCKDEGHVSRHQDAFRLATLIWTAEHGIATARISRPTFPWPPLYELVDEMVDRLMAFE